MRTFPPLALLGMVLVSAQSSGQGLRFVKSQDKAVVFSQEGSELWIKGPGGWERQGSESNTASASTEEETRKQIQQGKGEKEKGNVLVTFPGKGKVVLIFQGKGGSKSVALNRGEDGEAEPAAKDIERLGGLLEVPPEQAISRLADAAQTSEKTYTAVLTQLEKRTHSGYLIAGAKDSRTVWWMKAEPAPPTNPTHGPWPSYLPWVGGISIIAVGTAALIWWRSRAAKGALPGEPTSQGPAAQTADGGTRAKGPLGLGKWLARWWKPKPISGDGGSPPWENEVIDPTPAEMQVLHLLRGNGVSLQGCTSLADLGNRLISTCPELLAEKHNLLTDEYASKFDALPREKDDAMKKHREVLESQEEYRREVKEKLAMEVEDQVRNLTAQLEAAEIARSTLKTRAETAELDNGRLSNSLREKGEEMTRLKTDLREMEEARNQLKAEYNGFVQELEKVLHPEVTDGRE